MRKTALFLCSLLLLVFALPEAQAQTGPAADVAPTGKLRVAMIGANPVLVTKKADGSIGGVSADISAFIAQKLGVAYEPVVYADPAEYTKSFGTGAWDIAIGPRESATGAGLAVSPDFILVNNLFVVAPGRNIASAAEVDRPGVRLVVSTDGAPDKFLTPRFKSAEFVRVSANTDVVIDLFKSGKGDVYATNAQAIYAVADAMPGTKVLPEAFTSVPMAVALQKGRSPAAVTRISAIVNEAINGGTVAKAISAAGLRGVTVAAK